MSWPQERSKRFADATRQKLDVKKLNFDAEKFRLDSEKLQLDRDKFRVDILFKEYQNRFSEVVFHSGRYHKQVNFIQLYLTVLGSFFAILFSKDWSATLGALPNINVLYVQSGLISGAYLISLYLFTNVMDSLYAIYMNGRRLSAIEQEINRTAGADILVWDSEIVPRLFSSQKFFIGLWIRPNMILGVWSFLFFIGVTISLCFISYYVTNGFFYYFAPPAVFISCMLVVNWFLLHSDGLTFIDAAVRRTDFTASTRSTAITIALANFLLAYAPMALFSIRDHSFCGGSLIVPLISDNAFYGSVHKFPFCSIPSVWLGDLILIPIFDYFAIKWLFSMRRHLKSKLPVIAASAVIAITSTSILHWIWIHDAWNGFMDILPGELSEAGWIHAVYSVVQIFIVVTTLGLFTANWKQHRSTVFLGLPARQFRIATGVLLIFSCLAAWDWYVRNIIIFSHSYKLAFQNDWGAFTPIIAMLCFSTYAFMRTRPSVGESN